MKLIAYEGTNTKYTKGSTRDALILGLNTDFITGTRLDVYITNDNILIVLGPEGFNLIGLTEEELELTRRARNLPIPVGRRNIQTEYRQATAFETLIGWWHENNDKRLKEILNLLEPELKFD